MDRRDLLKMFCSLGVMGASRGWSGALPPRRSVRAHRPRGSRAPPERRRTCSSSWSTRCAYRTWFAPLFTAATPNLQKLLGGGLLPGAAVSFLGHHTAATACSPSARELRPLAFTAHQHWVAANVDVVSGGPALDPRFPTTLGCFRVSGWATRAGGSASGTCRISRRGRSAPSEIRFSPATGFKAGRARRLTALRGRGYVRTRRPRLSSRSGSPRARALRLHGAPP